MEVLTINNRETLQKGIEELNLTADNKQLNLFMDFMDLMLDWNKKINLTAITEPYEVITKHFIDSLTPLKYIEKYNLELNKVLDLGTGGGFPGIPLKIMVSDMNLLLADSLKKRVIYLQEVCHKLGFEDVEAYHRRAEQMGQNNEYREQFDTVFSRAVAEMNILVEYCLPMVKVGGIFVALKGPALDEELEDTNKAIQLLGGKILGVENFDLPLLEEERTLVFIKKVKETPNKYPRRPGMPKKRPI